LAKAPKFEFPKFNGNNPMEWLRRTEKYFSMVYVPEDAKFISSVEIPKIHRLGLHIGRTIV
jgi:hypothetical protein